MKFSKNRYLVAALLCSGIVIIYGLKIIINAIMTEMVYHAYVKLENGTSSGFCYQRQTKDRNVTSAFNWSTTRQTWIMEAHSWGYLFGNFPGAFMAELVSAKWTWFISVGANVACTFAFPTLDPTFFWSHFAVRITQGFFSGMIYPATAMLMAEWVPEEEKNTLGSIVFSGFILGSLLGRFVSTMLNHIITWRQMFFVMGGASATWLLLWPWLVFDRPAQCRYITEGEMTYIQKSHLDVTPRRKKIHVRWRKVFTSKPFWALLVMHSSCRTVFTIVMKDIPIYMWDVLRLDMHEIVIYLNAAYVTQWVFSLCLGRILDRLVRRKRITQSWARKISTLIISGPSLVCLMSLGYVKCNIAVAIALIVIPCVCFGGMNTGYLLNHVDIAPKIAGWLMAITNTFAWIGAVCAPVVIGAILDQTNRSIHTWREVFWICGGFFIVDMMCFTVWGSAENQHYYWVEDGRGHGEGKPKKEGKA